MTDILFCSLPYTNLDYIYSAPAILKGVVTANGYQAHTRDLGVELFKFCNSDLKQFYRVQQYFVANNSEHAELIDEFYNKFIDSITDDPPRYIGFSVLSFHTHTAVWEIVQKIRAANISTKIVIGGRGLESNFASFKYVRDLPAKEKIMRFDQLLVYQNYVDHVIIGDGEDAVLALLEEKVDVDNSKSEQFKAPIPDYSDYDLNSYQFPNNEIVWPIVGSKGCVRNCDFCDVERLFGKYRYRSGTDIATEMISMEASIGAKRFTFTDSLVNGAYKPFLEFLDCIGDHNLNHPEKAIVWSGNYICREPDQVPENFYKKLAQAGARKMIIGAESGSNYVLEKMNKKTTVEALFYELEQFRLHDIKDCMLLLMVGHWSERHVDFVKHCEMLVRLVPYFASGTVANIRVGFPASLEHVPPDTVKSTMAPTMIYHYKHNPNNTITEKVWRQLTIVKLARQLGILSNSFLVGDLTMSLNLIGGVEKVDTFYSEFFDAPRQSEARCVYENFEDFYQLLIANTQSPLDNLNVNTSNFLLASIAFDDNNVVQSLEETIRKQLVKHKY